jgi:hypothetical protein
VNRVRCGGLSAAALFWVLALACSAPRDLPDSGFIYLSRQDVAAALESLTVPLAATDTTMSAELESCACALWNGQPLYTFTSPVVPDAVVAAVGDRACDEQSVRKRGTPRFAVVEPVASDRCLDLTVWRESLIRVADTGDSNLMAKRCLQAALLDIVAWAPGLLSDVAVVTSTADLIEVMHGQPDTLASALEGYLWVPRDHEKLWRDSLSLAEGSASPPWFSATGDLAKLVIYTVHRARDGKVQLAPFTFLFKGGHIQDVESIFDPDYGNDDADVL